jgi:hypothetical protein
MPFKANWTPIARGQYDALKTASDAAAATRARDGHEKASAQEGLFKQVVKSINNLLNNPRHPSLHTHEYDSLPHPWNKDEKVWEAYAQNKTPGAYRVFWCYGPSKGEITIIAITPHP